MKYSWSYLKNNIRNGKWINDELKRDPIIQRKYEDHMKYVDKHYLTREDYIKIKYLNFDKRYADKWFALNTFNSLDYKLTENAFPYNVDRVRHQVLWSIDELTKEQIEFIVGKNAVWFINNPKSRTIRNLWHAQIFYIC